MALHGGKVPSRGPGSHAGGNPFSEAANPAIEQQISPPVRALANDPVPPDIAYQLVHDELMLDGSARLNLATFVTTWMEPQATRADGRVRRQEHDRQGRVPADRGDRAALRGDPRRPVARPGPDDGDRVFDHRLQRGLHAGRDGAQAPLGRAHRRRPGAQAEPGHGRECAGLLGEVLPLLGGRSRGLVPMEGDRLHLGAGGGGSPLRREHDRRRRDPRFDLRRQLRAGRRHRRGARRACGGRRSGRADARRRCVRGDDRAVPGPRPGLGFPTAARGVDQHLGAQVRPGLPRCRMGDLARRRRPARANWCSTSTTWAGTCRRSR